MTKPRYVDQVSHESWVPLLQPAVGLAVGTHYTGVGLSSFRKVERTVWESSQESLT